MAGVELSAPLHLCTTSKFKNLFLLCNCKVIKWRFRTVLLNKREVIRSWAQSIQLVSQIYITNRMENQPFVFFKGRMAQIATRVHINTRKYWRVASIWTMSKQKWHLKTFDHNRVINRCRNEISFTAGIYCANLEETFFQFVLSQVRRIFTIALKFMALCKVSSILLHFFRRTINKPAICSGEYGQIAIFSINFFRQCGQPMQMKLFQNNATPH